MASRFKDNPTGKAFEAMEDDGLRWRTVFHVGPHPPGTTVSRKDLGPGAQIDLLMKHKAIEQVTEHGIIVPHQADLQPGPPRAMLPVGVRPEPGSVPA